MLPEPFESVGAAYDRVKGYITIEILEQADILNAIARGFTIERIAENKMWLSRPSKAQIEGEKEGYYYEAEPDVL